MFIVQRLPLRQKYLRFAAVLPLILMLWLMPLMVSVAQDETGSEDGEPPVLQLLSLVPADISFTAGEWIGFSDFCAGVATRNGLTDYESWTEFQADLDAEALNPSLLLQTLPISGFLGARYLVVAGPDMPEVMGIDFFDIDAALTFNQPPEQAFIYQGDFDATQIDTALTNNGYVSETLGGQPYWCSEAGCDTGMDQNLANRNVANLFGGDLGRRFPVVLLDTYLVSSASDSQVEAVAEAYQGEADTLADDPIFQTAVAAMYGSFAEEIADQPQLRQAYFIPPDAFSGGDPAVFLNMTQEQIEQLRERLLTQAPDPLPRYELTVFTDFGNSTDQFAQVILVYNSQEDAQTAIEIVPQRIESVESLATRVPIQELFESRGGELLDPVVYEDEATGQYAAVFTFRYDAAPQEDEEGRLIMSGMVYQLLVQMASQRDTLWLAYGDVVPE
jgi:hypothetical protein